MIIIPIKWLFHWEYTLFSDKPNSYSCDYSEPWKPPMLPILFDPQLSTIFHQVPLAPTGSAVSVAASATVSSSGQTLTRDFYGRLDKHKGIIVICLLCLEYG